MGPDAIAVDEITAPDDCQALIRAAYCGVDLLATAHAVEVRDLCRRTVYKPLLDAKIFSTALVLRSDNSYKLERMDL